MNTELEIKILDKAFRVNCTPNEYDRLKVAVDYLNERVIEIASATKTVNVERIAVMAALNLTYELLSLNLPGEFDLAEFQRRMKTMTAKLEGLSE